MDYSWWYICHLSPQYPKRFLVFFFFFNQNQFHLIVSRRFGVDWICYNSFLLEKRLKKSTNHHSPPPSPHHHHHHQNYYNFLAILKHHHCLIIIIIIIIENDEDWFEMNHSFSSRVSSIVAANVGALNLILFCCMMISMLCYPYWKSLAKIQWLSLSERERERTKKQREYQTVNVISDIWVCGRQQLYCSTYRLNSIR